MRYVLKKQDRDKNRNCDKQSKIMKRKMSLETRGERIRRELDVGD